MGALHRLVVAAASWKPTKPISATCRKPSAAPLRPQAAPPPRMAAANKRAIVSLVERGGLERSFHPATADGETVAKIVRENMNAKPDCIPTKAAFITKLALSSQRTRPSITAPRNMRAVT